MKKFNILAQKGLKKTFHGPSFKNQTGVVVTYEQTKSPKLKKKSELADTFLYKMIEERTKWKLQKKGEKRGEERPASWKSKRC